MGVWSQRLPGFASQAGAVVWVLDSGAKACATLWGLTAGSSSCPLQEELPGEASGRGIRREWRKAELSAQCSASAQHEQAGEARTVKQFHSRLRKLAGCQFLEVLHIHPG